MASKFGAIKQNERFSLRTIAAISVNRIIRNHDTVMQGNRLCFITFLQVESVLLRIKLRERERERE